MPKSGHSTTELGFITSHRLHEYEVKNCVLQPAAGRRTQLFHLILTQPMGSNKSQPSTRNFSQLSKNCLAHCLTFTRRCPTPFGNTQCRFVSTPLAHSLSTMANLAPLQQIPSQSHPTSTQPLPQLAYLLRTFPLPPFCPEMTTGIQQRTNDAAAQRGAAFLFREGNR